MLLLLLLFVLLLLQLWFIYKIIEGKNSASELLYLNNNSRAYFRCHWMWWWLC